MLGKGNSRHLKDHGPCSSSLGRCGVPDCGSLSSAQMPRPRTGTGQHLAPAMLSSPSQGQTVSPAFSSRAVVLPSLPGCTRRMTHRLPLPTAQPLCPLASAAQPPDGTGALRSSAAFHRRVEGRSPTATGFVGVGERILQNKQQAQGQLGLGIVAGLSEV